MLLVPVSMCRGAAAAAVPPCCQFCGIRLYRHSPLPLRSTAVRRALQLDIHRLDLIGQGQLRAQGFTKVTLRVRLADGSVEEHCVWLADSYLERERGLMEITDPSLGGGDAMVFVFDADTAASFWMKDTLLPLSIAWVDSAGGVVNTATMDPCPAGATNCPQFPPGRPYRMAIEMAQGRLQDWGIGPGATVTLAGAC